MPSDKPSSVHGPDFAEMGSSSTVPAQHLDMADIRDVRLGLSADLGTCTMPVRDVLALKRGSVVALNKTAGEMTEIYVNGRLLARGEVVVINDNLHVRIAEVFGVTETTDE